MSEIHNHAQDSHALVAERLDLGDGTVLVAPHRDYRLHRVEPLRRERAHVFGRLADFADWLLTRADDTADVIVSDHHAVAVLPDRGGPGYEQVECELVRTPAFALWEDALGDAGTAYAKTFTQRDLFELLRLVEPTLRDGTVLEKLRALQVATSRTVELELNALGMPVAKADGAKVAGLDNLPTHLGVSCEMLVEVETPTYVPEDPAACLEPMVSLELDRDGHLLVRLTAKTWPMLRRRMAIAAADHLKTLLPDFQVGVGTASVSSLHGAELLSPS